MSTPAWPFITGAASRMQIDGLSGTPRLPVDHSPAGTGPSLSRQTDDIFFQTWRGSIILSTAEYATFVAFLRDTIAYGATPFSWYDPLTDAETIYKLLEWSDISFHSIGHWRLSITIEEQPG